MMAEVQDGHYDSPSQSTDGLRIDPIYESFLCPLTKQVMRDPVAIESGVTFEREAILKWFSESRSSGRKLVCPVTRKELRSTEVNPSIALRNTIDEWKNRNEVAKLDVARKSLTSESTESDILQALQYVAEICQRNRSSKHGVRKDGLISMIADLMKNGSTRVRQKALETLCVIAKDDNDNKVHFCESSFLWCKISQLMLVLTFHVLCRLRLLLDTIFAQLLSSYLMVTFWKKNKLCRYCMSSQKQRTYQKRLAVFLEPFLYLLA
jgi:hypothetical protein